MMQPQPLRLTLAVLLAMLGLTAALPACAPRANVKEEKPLVALGPRDRLFPLGVYRHAIRLFIAKKPDVPESKEVDAEFVGVVKLKADAVQMAALSSFGTTMFKINEDLKTGQVKVEIFVEQMRKFESRIESYYSVLRLLLLARLVPEADGRLKWTKTGPKGLPTEIQTTGFEKNSVFEFTKYDDDDVPVEVEIMHPQFKVTVRVSGYES